MEHSRRGRVMEHSRRGRVMEHSRRGRVMEHSRRGRGDVLCIIIFYELQLGYQSFSNMIFILLLTMKLKYISAKYILELSLVC